MKRFELRCLVVVVAMVALTACGAGVNGTAELGYSSAAVNALCPDAQACSPNNPNSLQRLTPVLECVVDNGNGTYAALFGYNNSNTCVVDVALGGGGMTNFRNDFTPAQDRGQSVSFCPGRARYVFAFDFDGSSQMWTLRTPKGGGTATASNNPALRCPNNRFPGTPGAYAGTTGSGSSSGSTPTDNGTRLVGGQATAVECTSVSKATWTVSGTVESTGSVDSIEVGLRDPKSARPMMTVATLLPQDFLHEGRYKTVDFHTSYETGATASSVEVCLTQSGAQGREVKQICYEVNTALPTTAPPTLSAIANQRVARGSRHQLGLSASPGEAGAPLFLALSSAPSYLSLADAGGGTGTLTIAPGPQDSDAPVRVKVVDKNCAAAEVEFTVAIFDVVVLSGVEVSASALTIRGSGFTDPIDVSINGKEIPPGLIGRAADGSIVLARDMWDENLNLGCDNRLVVQNGGGASDVITFRLENYCDGSRGTMES